VIILHHNATKQTATNQKTAKLSDLDAEGNFFIPEGVQRYVERVKN
jgi:hypothetical protein